MITCRRAIPANCLLARHRLAPSLGFHTYKKQALPRNGGLWISRREASQSIQFRHSPEGALSYNPSYARIRLRHPCVGMAHLANALPASPAEREACQATGPACSLGHIACRRRLLTLMAKPFLGTVPAALADRALHSLFRPRRPSLLDRRPRSRPPMANRRRSQRRSRTDHFGPLPLRPPSHLYIHALHRARHGFSDHALVAVSTLHLVLRHRHGDPRTDRGQFAGLALWQSLCGISAARPSLHPLLEIAEAPAAPSLILCIYPVFRNPGVPLPQRGAIARVQEGT